MGSLWVQERVRQHAPHPTSSAVCGVIRSVKRSTSGSGVPGSITAVKLMLLLPAEETSTSSGHGTRAAVWSTCACVKAIAQRQITAEAVAGLEDERMRNGGARAWLQLRASVAVPVSTVRPVARSRQKMGAMTIEDTRTRLSV